MFVVARPWLLTGKDADDVVDEHDAADDDDDDSCVLLDSMSVMFGVDVATGGHGLTKDNGSVRGFVSC